MAVGPFLGMRVDVERVGLHLNVLFSQLVERRSRFAQRIAERFPARLAAERIGHAHAPRLIGQEHQRGRLTTALGVDQRRPPQRQNGQHGRDQTQGGQRQTPTRRQPIAGDAHQAHQHQQSHGQQGRQPRAAHRIDLPLVAHGVTADWGLATSAGGESAASGSLGGPPPGAIADSADGCRLASRSWAKLAAAERTC